VTEPIELPDLDRSARAARVSVCVVDADTGAVLAERDPDLTMRTASVAKVFALVELAARLEAGDLRADVMLDRRSVAPVRDSGLWQHLRVDELALEDVAVLVASVSDNLATNALLDLLGLAQVQARAAQLAPGGSTLHDVVRDERLGEDPPTLSSGSAGDWAGLFAALHRGEVVSPGVSSRVLRWCARNTDLSMVASSLDLDPLSHEQPDQGLRLSNKTGTDVGMRADVGLVRGPRHAVAYAVICNWEASDTAARSQVLAQMRAIGERIRASLEPLTEPGSA
jgi:beta-lactamase class A